MIFTHFLRLMLLFYSFTHLQMHIESAAFTIAVRRYKSAGNKNKYSQFVHFFFYIFTQNFDKIHIATRCLLSRKVNLICLARLGWLTEYGLTRMQTRSCKLWYIMHENHITQLKFTQLKCHSWSGNITEVDRICHYCSIKWINLSNNVRIYACGGYRWFWNNILCFLILWHNVSLYLNSIESFEVVRWRFLIIIICRMSNKNRSRIFFFV